MKHLEQAVGPAIAILLLGLVYWQRRRLNRHFRDDRD
jgi:hypothetical protein